MLVLTYTKGNIIVLWRDEISCLVLSTDESLDVCTWFFAIYI